MVIIIYIVVSHSWISRPGKIFELPKKSSYAGSVVAQRNRFFFIKITLFFNKSYMYTFIQIILLQDSREILFFKKKGKSETLAAIKQCKRENFQVSGISS